MGLRRVVTTCTILAVLLYLGANLFRYSLMKLPAEAPKYPTGIPNKFDPEGNVQRFKGNTIIAHLSPTSELYTSFLALHEKLKNSHLNHLYVLLPPSSWHATIFEGVCDKIRKPGRWPADLSNATIEKCNSLYERRLSSFEIESESRYHFTVTKFKPLNKSGIGMHLEPSAEDEPRLRQLRDRLSKLLGIRAKDHKTYAFHLSVAYLLRYLTEEQEQQLSELLTDHFEGMPKELELGPPEFCTFEDIFTFKQVFYLGNQ
ncbi:RNA ligase/cyclic nucleotide phosphodiesterase [Mycena galopus ATCC 62051]|nr:RNA ligase/cyclic nucleotide phosphodiesterase [Mycena galopus ATCC 62051]